jgi:hypothetical protein
MGHIGCMGHIGRFFQKTAQAAVSISHWLRLRGAVAPGFLWHGPKRIVAAWSLGQPECLAASAILAFEGTLYSRR